jgi:hypothetical protein
MPRLTRMALALPLAAILATTALLAAPPGGDQPWLSAVTASGPMDLATQLWSFLTSIGSKNGSQADPSGVQTKNGSQADPSGNSLAPIPATTKGNNGYQAEPNG